MVRQIRPELGSGQRTPLVSVLMPVFNRQEYVPVAVASIVRQSFEDFEFVIVNDGSTDGTSAILREYARRDSRIVLIEQENAGYTRALNRGLQEARGEFVARMDSDDVSLPGRFEVQVQYLRKHPNVVAVGGQGVEIDIDGDAIRPIRMRLDHDAIDRRRLGLTDDERGGMIHPSVMMRRAAVLQVGQYRPEYEPAEDRDLWLRLAEVGRLANVPETVIQYRVHAGCVSQARAGRQHAAARSAIEDACRRRGLELPERIELWSLEERQTEREDRDGGIALTAARNGYYRTARKYLMRALRRCPWDGRAWKAAAICLLRADLGRKLGVLRQGTAGKLANGKLVCEQVEDLPESARAEAH